MNNFKNTLIQITNYGMGQGDDELGLVLLKNYLNLLAQEKEPPKFIALYNSGVKIITTDSPVLKEIKQLESKGLKILACKTCLNHFGIADKVDAGIVGSMMDIIELQKLAGKVIAL